MPIIPLLTRYPLSPPWSGSSGSRGRGPRSRPSKPGLRWPPPSSRLRKHTAASFAPARRLLVLGSSVLPSRNLPLSGAGNTATAG